MKNYVLAAIFFILFVLTYELLKIDIVIHETSHYLVGKLLGGDCTIRLYWKGGGETVCKFAYITKGGLILYSLAGVLAELFVSLILLAFPFTSALGGYMFYSTALSNFAGAYTTDFNTIGFYVPLNPVFRVLFLMIGIIVLLLNILRYFKFFLKYKTKK